MSTVLPRWKKLCDWWRTPLGQAFIAAEKGVVKKMIPTLFGYHFLLLGKSAFIPCMAESPIMHKVWMQRELPANQENTENTEVTEVKASALIARQDKLPIMADGVDVVYLAHCLESIKNPHEVLRETFRVLIPEGHVIISLFNPWSLWGLWRYVVRFIKQAPWDGHFISAARLKDWLALLGFDVVEVQPYFFRPPIAHVSILKRLEWLETLGRWCWPFWSGGYVLLARKRIITLTPIKPLLPVKEKILVADVIQPVRSE